MKGGEKSGALLQLHLAVLLFGGAGLFAKLTTLSPIALVLGRTIWASLFLFVWMNYKKESLTWSKKKWQSMLLLGALLALHWVAFYQSIQYSTIAVGLLTFATFPIFTVLLNALFYKQTINSRALYLACMAFLGVLVMVFDGRVTFLYFWGILWGLAAAAAFASLTLLNKRWLANYSANQVAFLQNLGAALCLLPLGCINQWSTQVEDYLWLALLGIVFTGISHTLFIKSLKKIKVEVASMTAALEPIYGIIWGLIILGEWPGYLELIGGFIILLAMLLTLQKRLDKPL